MKSLYSFVHYGLVYGREWHRTNHFVPLTPVSPLMIHILGIGYPDFGPTVALYTYLHLFKARKNLGAKCTEGVVLESWLPRGLWK